ncbi:MAG: hypothetical protein RIG67_21550 [Rhodospirillales bacterium]
MAGLYKFSANNSATALTSRQLKTFSKVIAKKKKESITSKADSAGKHGGENKKTKAK